jgi:transposase
MIESTGNAIEEQDYQALTKEWLKPLYYLAMPMGGGQLKKTAEGLSMFNGEHPIAGSYTDSGALRFPVEDTFGNRLQAGLFGQWANENAREYFEAGHAPLDEKNTKEFSDSGLSIQDYWAYRDGLRDLNKASEDGNATLAEQADYIFGLDMPIETKNLLVNNLSQRKEPIDLSGMGAYSGFEEYDFATDDPEKYEWLKANGITVKEYNGLDEDAKDELDFVYKYPEKYSFLRENGYSYSTYKNADEDGKRALTWASENPDKYQLSKAVTGDLFKYRELTGALYDIKADKDSEGKSISGSRKKKVVEYLNGLDLEYGEKIILYKSEYQSDDTYNMAIIEYLNSRDDISYDQMEAILKELGFNVDSQGNVTW